MRSDLKSELRRQLVGEFYSVRAEFHTPRRKRTPSVWATQVRRLAAGSSPVTDKGYDIPYEHRFMPHCVEPMDAADDPDVNIIALMFHRRGGKTNAVCGNIIGRTLTDDPGPIYSMFPTEESSTRFSRDDINPMIEATPALQEIVVEAKSRDSGRTKSYIRYAGGSINFVFAGSASATRALTARVIMIHECDDPAYAAGTGGDIIARAFGRGDGFNGIKIIESTPTLTNEIGADGVERYRSRIAQWHDLGDKRKWFCQCRRCGQLQWLKFAQIRAPRDNMEKAEYFCERCDAEHNEGQWRRMVAGGKWFPTAGLTDTQLLSIEASARLARARDPIVRSYWINGFNSLLPKGKGFRTKLHQFVSEASRAKEHPRTFQVWTNEVAVELWDPDTELEASPEIRPMMMRREDYATDAGVIAPAGALVLTAGIDVQQDRIELSWWGWGRNEESWVIDHVVIDGEVHFAEVWQALRVELQRRFDHGSGAKIGLSFALIDAGHQAEHVYRFIRTIPAAGKLRACRGASIYPHPVIGPYRPKGISGPLGGHWIGGDICKDILYARARLARTDPLPAGWMHFGKRLTDVWFKQFTSEQVTIRGDQRRYKNDAQRRNEALDCAVYAFAAFKRRLWNFDAIEAQLIAEAGASGVPSEPSTKRAEWFAGGKPVENGWL